MSNKSDPDSVRIGIAWQEPVMLQVGKGGISVGTIAEAKKLLKKHKYIKVRLLRSTGSDKHTKKGIFESLCNDCDADLIGVRGNTAVIFKPRGKRRRA